MRAAVLAPPPGLLLSVAVLAAAVLTGFLLVRAARRATRGRGRRRASDVFRLLGGRLAGQVGVRTLRDAVRDVEAEAFWDATEAITTTLRHGERLELARSLGRNPHVATERRRLAEEDSVPRRELAARRLGMLPGGRSRRVLRRALVAGPEVVSFAAARSLAQHRDLQALRWLLEHPQALSRRPLPSLAGLLRAFGPAARAMLLAALERGLADTRFECATLEALGVWRCRSAREAIQARLRGPQVELRVAAARALGRLGMGEAIPGLILSLADAAWPVRAIAAQSLGRLRAAPAVEALVVCVSDPAWWVRRHAAYALAAIPGEGHDALCELVARSPDRYAREMAREALDFGTRQRFG
ncbi:MAG TPA: HEAT repeat domain-containing protein [Candidatus Eisenbacteria bacterium]|nr:HEAT repeat domain-containing protein [Candidatus Eisenbacteria bacterium]